MENLFAQCVASISGNQPVLLALFFGGLTGGFTHCLTMCGSFAACRNACRSSCWKSDVRSQSVAARWSDRLNLMHHLGRATSYGALGVVAALLAHQVTSFRFWPKLEALLLVIAGSMFLASSLSGAMRHLDGSAFAFARRLGQWLVRIGRPLQLLSDGTRTYVRGALLGFMPCGLIYAALMAVAATANPWVGALGMVAFVVGTLPALWVASLSVELLSLRWRDGMRSIGRVAMACNGVALLVIASNLMM